MENKKVLIVICTKDNVMKECLDAVNNQDYKNYSTLIHIMKPRKSFEEINLMMPEVLPKLEFTMLNMHQSVNIADNKELARKMALGSDADYFFFLDSDVVIPLNAVSELVKQLETPPPTAEQLKEWEQVTRKPIIYKKKKVIAGYYPFKEDANKWVLGNFIGQGIINTLTYVKPSLTRVHYAGCGCIMISRDVLEKLVWNAGIDNLLKNTEGYIIFEDDSVNLCVQILKLGEEIWANGDVVCKHLKEKRNE